MTDRLCKATAAALLAAGMVLLIAAGATHTSNPPKRPGTVTAFASDQIATQG